MTKSLIKYDKNGKLRITDNSRSYVIHNDNNKYYYMKNNEKISCTAKVNKYKKGGLNFREGTFLKFNVWPVDDEGESIYSQQSIVDVVLQIDPLNNNNRNLALIMNQNNNLQVPIAVFPFDGPNAGPNANLTQDEWETQLIQILNDRGYEAVSLRNW